MALHFRVGNGSRGTDYNIIYLSLFLLEQQENHLSARLGQETYYWLSPPTKTNQETKADKTSLPLWAHAPAPIMPCLGILPHGFKVKLKIPKALTFVQFYLFCGKPIFIRVNYFQQKSDERRQREGQSCLHLIMRQPWRPLAAGGVRAMHF